MIMETIRRQSVPIERKTWTPVRFIRDPQVCAFCWQIIPNGRPGSTTGSRGTKAWYCPEHRVYECLGCRSEATDAELRVITAGSTGSGEVAA